MKQKFFIKHSLMFICLIGPLLTNGSINKKINYRTSFGNCPSRSSGSLTFKLIAEFEKNRSLGDVKKLMISEKLSRKYFLSDYKIHYNPLKKSLKFSYQCPEALLKAQIYKKEINDYYEAILVSNGKLYDPTYEVLLKSENKIKKDLPLLALPVGEIDQKSQQSLAKIIVGLNRDFRKYFSEMIISENKELTVILSIKNTPVSAFLGKDLWDQKFSKLSKVISYVQKKKRFPSVINLTNLKKIVVKFRNKI